MRRNPSILISILCLAALASLCLFMAGCSTVSGPPSPAEQSLFNVTTNYIEEVSAVRRQVPVVTEQEIGLGGETVRVTNWVSETVLVTNRAPVYEFAPGAKVQTIRESAERIGNLIAPGSGTLVGLAVGGVASVWASIRSRRSRKVSAGLVQAIETARAVLQTTPDGQKADREFVAWLQKHQAEQGVIKEVLQLVQEVADDKDAARVAREITRLVEERR